MPIEKEKLLRQFKVFDVDGSLLQAINITYHNEIPDMYAVKTEGQSYYAPTMEQAMAFAETIHLTRARQNGHIVKQTLL